MKRRLTTGLVLAVVLIVSTFFAPARAAAELPAAPSAGNSFSGAAGISAADLQTDGNKARAGADRPGAEAIFSTSTLLVLIAGLLLVTAVPASAVWITRKRKRDTETDESERKTDY